MSITCDRCQNIDSIIEYNGELVCCKCGLVYQERVIADEYETYEGEENQIKRIGPPEKPEQAREPGTILIIKEKGTKKIIKTYQKRSKIDRNNFRIQKYLESAGICQNLIDATQLLYEELAPNKNMQGRNFKHIIAALYYYALRIKNKAQSFKEVAKQFPSLTERQIKKAFSNIKWHIADQNDEDRMVKIEKNLIQLHIGGILEKCVAKKLSFEIIENINDKALLEGKSPNTVAGLSLSLSYKLLNDNSGNDEDFYRTFSSKATIIKAFEEIKCDLDKIVPQKYSDKINEIKFI
jgi:transcription initiation factor TFIIIB Brf1 subunit/transcription initiation factor TFIIB